MSSDREKPRFVTIEAAMEQLGGSCEWDLAGKIATVTFDDVTAQIFAGQTTIHANGEALELSEPPFVEGSRLYVPADLPATLAGLREAA